eukprot:scaffold227_cov173-Ochromonas_danica.AAC.14
MIGAIDNARQVFERWMEWQPDDLAWAAFIKFEVRQGEITRARNLYERYITCYPTTRAYLKYARWEEHQKPIQPQRARLIYERALESIHENEKIEKIIIQFARFEERWKEYDRARCIYQYAIDQLSQRGSEEVEEVKKEFIAFEKKHGDRATIESVLLQQKRDSYEERLQADYYHYDLWFDYIRLEESESNDIDKIRQVYERAVSYRPPILEKRHWQRYIYLWINWAIYEELIVEDIPRAREVYRRCLEEVIPHRRFTFGKIWLLAAQLEVRQKDLSAARKILGNAIGLCGKENIFKGYLDLELQLGEVDRCRLIYAKYLENMPTNGQAWRAFAQLEAKVGEIERARAIYELAISLGEMEMPELLWKAYIDMEVAEGEIERARQLYERLLDRSDHVKVWISFATFELEQKLLGEQQQQQQSEEEELGAVRRSRSVYARGYEILKRTGRKEERLSLLESWRDMEADALRNELPGSSREELGSVENRFPRKVKMRRPVENGEGEEDYFDYIFPDDEKKLVGMKLLEKALAWKTSGESVLGKRTAQEQEQEQEAD